MFTLILKRCRHTRSLSRLITDYSYHLQVYHDLCDAAQNSDEVKNVPRVSKVVLWKTGKTLLVTSKKDPHSGCVLLFSLTRKPKAKILRTHSTEKRTVNAVFRCFSTESYAGGAE